MTATASVLRKVDEYLTYDFSRLLGKGGFAFVFPGTWKNPSADPLIEGRDVAVKRIQKVPSNHTTVQKEVELMLKVKEHPNILQCFSTHSNDDFL